MKRLLLVMICALASANALAWHKAELQYDNGSVARAEIKFPDETFGGIFKRAILVKDGEDENYLDIKKLSKIVLSNGLTFIKFDNNGKPVLLEQVTRYNTGVNILVLPSVYSSGYVEASHYVYRVDGNNTFEEEPVSYDRAQINYDVRSGGNTNGAHVNPYDFNPVGIYYSFLTRNGHLYVPGTNDYIYLMKDNHIERLLSGTTYSTLNNFMGDNPAISKLIKKGVSSFLQLNVLVGEYNGLNSMK